MRTLLPTLLFAALPLVGEEVAPAPVPAPVDATASAVMPPTAAPPAPADELIPKSPLPERLNSLHRMGEEERTLLLHELTYERQKVYDELIAKLGSTSDEARRYAAFLLGFYRMEQAAPHLAKIIWLSDAAPDRMVLVEGQWIRQATEVWFWNRYPAAEALVKIGEPALPYAIELLADEDDATIRGLAASVALAIAHERAAPEVAKAAAAESSAKRRKRLQAAAALFAPKPAAVPTE